MYRDVQSIIEAFKGEGFDYIIDELLHLQGCGPDKETYYKQIIKRFYQLDIPFL